MFHLNVLSKATSSLKEWEAYDLSKLVHIGSAATRKELNRIYTRYEGLIADEGYNQKLKDSLSDHLKTKPVVGKKGVDIFKDSTWCKNNVQEKLNRAVHQIHEEYWNTGKTSLEKDTVPVVMNLLFALSHIGEGKGWDFGRFQVQKQQSVFSPANPHLDLVLEPLNGFRKFHEIHDEYSSKAGGPVLGDNYDPRYHQKLLQRLKTGCMDEFADWAFSLRTAFEHRIAQITFILSGPMEYLHEIRLLRPPNSAAATPPLMQEVYGQKGDDSEPTYPSNLTFHVVDARVGVRSTGLWNLFLGAGLILESPGGIVITDRTIRRDGGRYFPMSRLVGVALDTVWTLFGLRPVPENDERNKRLLNGLGASSLEIFQCGRYGFKLSNVDIDMRVLFAKLDFNHDEIVGVLSNIGYAMFEEMHTYHWRHTAATFALLIQTLKSHSTADSSLDWVRIERDVRRSLGGEISRSDEFWIHQHLHGITPKTISNCQGQQEEIALERRLVCITLFVPNSRFHNMSSRIRELADQKAGFRSDPIFEVILYHPWKSQGCGGHFYRNLKLAHGIVTDIHGWKGQPRAENRLHIYTGAPTLKCLKNGWALGQKGWTALSFLTGLGMQENGLKAVSYKITLTNGYRAHSDKAITVQEGILYDDFDKDIVCFSRNFPILIEDRTAKISKQKRRKRKKLNPETKLNPDADTKDTPDDTDTVQPEDSNMEDVAEGEPDNVKKPVLLGGCLDEDSIFLRTKQGFGLDIYETYKKPTTTEDSDSSCTLSSEHSVGKHHPKVNVRPRMGLDGADDSDEAEGSSTGNTPKPGLGAWCVPLQSRLKAKKTPPPAPRVPSPPKTEDDIPPVTKKPTLVQKLKPALEKQPSSEEESGPGGECDPTDEKKTDFYVWQSRVSETGVSWADQYDIDQEMKARGEEPDYDLTWTNKWALGEFPRTPFRRPSRFRRSVLRGGLHMPARRPSEPPATRSKSPFSGAATPTASMSAGSAGDTPNINAPQNVDPDEAKEENKTSEEITSKEDGPKVGPSEDLTPKGEDINTQPKDKKSEEDTSRDHVQPIEIQTPQDELPSNSDHQEQSVNDPEPEATTMPSPPRTPEDFAQTMPHGFVDSFEDLMEDLPSYLSHVRILLPYKSERIPVDTPQDFAESIPQQPQEDTPMEIIVRFPVPQRAVDFPIRGPPKSPAEVPVEIPVAVTTEDLADNPTGVPTDPEPATDIPAETQIEVGTDEPSKNPSEAPSYHPTGTPINSPPRDPSDIPIPATTTAEPPVEPTTDAPVETATDAPPETTVNAPPETAANAPPEAASDAPVETTSDAQAETTTGPPVEASEDAMKAEAPPETPTEAPLKIPEPDPEQATVPIPMNGATQPDDPLADEINPLDTTPNKLSANDAASNDGDVEMSDSDDSEDAATKRSQPRTPQQAASKKGKSGNSRKKKKKRGRKKAPVKPVDFEEEDDESWYIGNKKKAASPDTDDAANKEHPTAQKSDELGGRVEPNGAVPIADQAIKRVPIIPKVKIGFDKSCRYVVSRKAYITVEQIIPYGFNTDHTFAETNTEDVEKMVMEVGIPGLYYVKVPAMEMPMLISVACATGLPGIVEWVDGKGLEIEFLTPGFLKGVKLQATESESEDTDIPFKDEIHGMYM
ncbi:hypothetical protein TWF730_007080 [Orbilia blumenaviensis]|uniref:Uncharacterized protein n=1 Tax=Orbilia blumenaviensis TaxID=1796055 RepID=A0AAV9VG68_9PEZI